jgi:hypothetical protein
MAVYVGDNSTNVIPSNASQYSYLFERNVVSDIAVALKDNTPNTYFEYEKLNVSNLNGPDFDYEFKFRNTINNQNTLISWNESDDSPLKMALVMEKKSSYQANSVTITPFFGYDNQGIETVKVTAVYVETNDSGFPAKENILQEPITIGSSVVPTDVKSIVNTYFKTAVIKFPQRRVSKVTIHFEQPNSRTTTIKHVYWEVSSVNQNYQFSVQDATKLLRSGQAFDQFTPPSRTIWSANTRFNPNLIYSDPLYSEVSGIANIVSSLVSPIANPVLTKRNTSMSTRVSFSAKKDVTYTYYVMKVLDKRNSTSSNSKYIYLNDGEGGALGFNFITGAQQARHELSLVPAGSTPYQNWWPAIYKLSGSDSFGEDTLKFISNTNIDDPAYGEILLPYSTTPNYAQIAATPYYRLGISEQAREWWQLKYRLTGVEKQPSYIGSATPAYWLGNYRVSDSEIITERKEIIVKPSVTFNVNLNKKYEILKNGDPYNNQILNVKRWGIGIRDISIENHVYQTSAEIISKPFNFPYPIEYLMLYSKYSMPVFSTDYEFEETSPFISYYISIDGGSEWLPISPVEDPFNQNIPEIYAINQKASTETRIPGVAYIESSSDVNSIRVKIQIRKPVSANGTPIVDFYQIAARVKRS